MFYALFQILPVLVWGFLFFALVRPLKLRPAGETACGLALLAASQKFVVYRLLGSDVFNPDLPAWAIQLSGWLYAATMMLFWATLALGTLGLLLRPFRKAPAALPLRRRRQGAAALAAGALALAAAGMWEGARVPDVRAVDLPCPGLPAAFEGYRLVHLSDLHVSPATRAAHVRAIAARANALKPDLVCVTGDFVDGTPAARLPDLAPLAGLRAADGVLACTGNHEYYSGFGGWKPAFAKLGITFLENTRRDIARRGSVLAVAGVNDPAGAPYGFPPPDAQAAFAGAPAGAYRILLTHRPTGTAAHAALGVRLQLSGHTHGGAIWGLHFLVARIGNEGHVGGLYREHGLTLHVSPGTGQWAGFPLRLGRPAEITLLRLRAAPRGEARR